MSKKKALKILGGMVVIEVLAIVLVVWLFDPFYQYHEPFFGLQKVLYDRDNQVPGSLRNFEYDRVMLGSSMVENFDTDYLDRQDGLVTVKAIKSAGRTADLLYYLDVVHEHQDVKEIYWGLDIAGLTADPETVMYGEDIPRYLHTDTMLDDLEYLFNKQVIFEKIPLNIASSFLDNHVGGEAYQWHQDKVFGSEQAMSAYDKPAENLPPQDVTQYKIDIQKNVQMIAEEINAHPEIEYKLFFTPYSMLWWDCGYANGISEAYFCAIEEAMTGLLECENAELYFFQTEKEIVCDLENYMDMFHYKPWVNQYMLEAMEKGDNRLTKDNYQEALSELQELFEYIVEEGIYLYYEENNTVEGAER